MRSIWSARGPRPRARGRSSTGWTSRPARKPAVPLRRAGIRDAARLRRRLAGNILIGHESKTEPPNEFTVDLSSGRRTKLTDIAIPHPG